MSEKDYSHLIVTRYVGLKYDAYEYADQIILEGSEGGCGCCVSSFNETDNDTMLDYLDHVADLTEEKASKLRRQASLLREHGPTEMGRVMDLIEKVAIYLGHAVTFMDHLDDGGDLYPYDQSIADKYPSIAQAIAGEIDKALVYYRQLDSTGKAIGEVVDQWTMEKIATNFGKLGERVYIPSGSDG